MTSEKLNGIHDVRIGWAVENSYMGQIDLINQPIFVKPNSCKYCGSLENVKQFGPKWVCMKCFMDPCKTCFYSENGKSNSKSFGSCKLCYQGSHQRFEKVDWPECVKCKSLHSGVCIMCMDKDCFEPVLSAVERAKRGTQPGQITGVSSGKAADLDTFELEFMLKPNPSLDSPKKRRWWGQ